MFLALFAPALAGVVLNEVVYRTSESGTESEWIELCNSGTTDVDLTGYTLEAALSTYETAYTFTSGTLAAGGYTVVGTGGTYGPLTTALGNATSSSDAVRIRDAGGTVVDTLVYGSPNTDSWTDDAGANNRLGPESDDDESIGRTGTCFDTDDASLDFTVFATPSPGAANADADVDTGDSGDTGGGGGADCTGSSGVVVNEIDYTTDAEWVELYNGTGATVTVSGWLLEWGNGGWEHEYAFGDGVTLADGGFLVVGAAGAAVKDIEQAMDLGNATSTADGVRLACGGAAVDTVIYGASNSEGWVDDTGATATSLAPKPSSGKTVARVVDGGDTDTSADDFVAAVGTPGATNAGEQVDCSGAAGVVINEFTPESGLEWVEFYNGSGADVTLTGWAFEFGTSDFDERVDFDDGLTLAAGSYLVLGAAGAAIKDIEVDMGSFGNAGTNPDGLRIVCGNTTIDTVIYGGEGDTNTDHWTQDDGTEATSYAPVADDGEASARLTDGWDTDVCGSDFALATATPGAANPVVTPPTCDTTGWESLKLNEVLYNPDGADGGQDWVELVNAGSGTVTLDGGTLEGAKSAWGVMLEIPGGTTLGPGEFLVIGGDEADDADLVGDVDLGTGSEGDGVRILDCEGVVRDTVLWGDAGGDGLTDDLGEENLVANVDEASSMGRYPDGEDDDAVSDWFSDASPTPGAANSDPTGSSDTGYGTGKGGCGDRPGSDRPGSGCATVLPLGGAEVLLAALALVRRRRT